MKRFSSIASVVVLLVLLLQAGGLWMGIKSLQALRVVQQELRAKSNPNNAVCFTISKARFQACALDDGKELKLDGNMFDVISITAEGDSLRVSALEDHFEARLIACLIDLSCSNENDQAGDAYLFALMHLNFIPPAFTSIHFKKRVSASESPIGFIHLNGYATTIESIDQPPEA